MRADAKRQITRGELHPQRELWQTWARDEGRMRQPLPGPEPTKRGAPPKMPVEAWSRIARALGESPAAEDQELAQAVHGFINRMPVHGTRELAGGDKAVDGRAAEAGRLHHRGQAREQSRRAGGAARRRCEAIHGSRRASDARSVGAVALHRSDDFSA